MNARASLVNETTDQERKRRMKELVQLRKRQLRDPTSWLNREIQGGILARSPILGHAVIHPHMRRILIAELRAEAEARWFLAWSDAYDLAKSAFPLVEGSILKEAVKGGGFYSPPRRKGISRKQVHLALAAFERLEPLARSGEVRREDLLHELQGNGLAPNEASKVIHELRTKGYIKSGLGSWPGFYRRHL